MIMNPRSDSHRFLHLHVIVKIVVLISMIIGVFWITTFWAIPVFFIFIVLYMCLQGYGRAAKNYTLVFCLLSILLYANHMYQFNGIIFTEFYFFMLWKMIPLFMTLHLLMKTQPGEIIALLQAVGLSHKITLIIVVIFRFGPTLSSEIATIKQNMKSRGMLRTQYVAAHPVMTLEHALIPLLLKSLNIADELSISAITRGVEAPGRKYSYYSRKLQRGDYICLLMVLVILGSIVVIGGVL